MAPSRIDIAPASITIPSKKVAQKPATSVESDWLDDFYREGYVVIKGAIPKERAERYQSEALDWLEGFGLGFDRNDKSTWKKENVPQSWKGGMYLWYAAAHEKYVWDARCEPGVIAPFAKLWGTEELLVSFDTVNITIPPSIAGEYDSQPWPHCDQNPKKKDLSCVQGIIQLSTAGPDDGGLIVMKGSAPLFRRFFEDNPVSGPTPWLSAKHQDFHPFTNENLEWYKAQGCELIKVCAEPGDLIMWDSRQVHWAKYSDSEVLRTLIYATYTPASWMTPEDQVLKKDMFEKTQTTTHWPHCNLYTHGGAKIMVDGKEVPDPLDRTKPVTKRVLTEKLLKLAGAMPY